MSIDIIIPSLGESVTEATIAKWHKSKGDYVEVDELLLELETDKVNLEVNSPSSGVITEIRDEEGATVSVEAVVGTIDEKAKKQANTQPITQEVTKPERSQDSSTQTVFSPAAQKIASENNIASVTSPSGKDGRVTKGDVLNALSAPAIAEQKTSALEEKRVKMSRLRQTIAKRLKESQNTAAILSTFNEVDMTAVMECRKKYQEIFKEKHNVKLGFMSFFVKAVITALKEIPAVNAEIDGDHIIYKNYYNIGVAVGTEQGLVVPVISDADHMGFSELEKCIIDLGKKAREGRLSMKDMQGGTFSITNGGIYGSLLSTPIINPPQSAILGMHNIVQRPVAINGEVKIRPMMYLALSYDHRLIDGSEAVVFLRRIKEMIENPDRMLLAL